ncbi:MAG: PQQ-binding-like beta-propeller repeat protein [Pirellulales bacterium]|nr:PQQ-binding-like beta-propeller repeat protein [Pirellulales bacterium]
MFKQIALSIAVVQSFALIATAPSSAETALRWSVELPVRQSSWIHVRDMQRDNNYEPTAAGDLVFIGCEHNGALLALDAKTGDERWRFYTNGAIRTQAIADDKRVIVASDDGHAYCLSHEGKLQWKGAVGPGERYLIGHQRITSAWPVPTRPIMADGKVFVLGGCWPADGVHMNAFDIETGKLLWRSPTMHMRSMRVPLFIRDGHVHVRTYSGTGGRATRFDLETGVASSWPKDLSKSLKRGPAEPVQVPGATDLASSSKSGGLAFGSGKNGTVYCAGPALGTKAKHHARSVAPAQGEDKIAKAIVDAAGHSEGYVLVAGLTDGKTVEGLLRNSKLYVVAVDSDPAKVDRIRRELDVRGCLDDHRLSMLSLKLAEDVLPPYFASIVLTESGQKPSDVALASLRPYGGAAVHLAGNTWKAEKRGALEGAGNWSHEYANASMNNSSGDSLLKAPLGILWYGGPASDRKYYLHGNRPTASLVGDGRMFLQGDGYAAGIDIYTGRLLWEIEIPKMHIYNGTHGGGGGSLSKSTPWKDEKAAAKGVPPIKHSRATGFNWAAADDCIYLFAAEQCLRFDPATGESKPAWKMPLPKDGDEELCWGHPRIAGDVLVATAFRPSDMRDARIGIGGNGGDWTGDRMPMSHVFAVDRKSGTLLWSHRAKWGFNNRAFVATDSRVFCTDLLQNDAVEGFLEAGRKLPAADFALRAFDLKSGSEVWTKKLDNLIKYLTYVDKNDMLLVPNRYGRTWTGKGWAWPGVPERETRRKSGRPNGTMWAYRGKTGELIWEVSEQHYDGPFSVFGEKILNRYGTSFDPKTGKLATRVSPLTGIEESYGFKKSGCAVLGGCDSIVAWRTAYHDMNTGTSVQLPGFEAGCTTSLLPAGGVLNMPNFGMFHLRSRVPAVALAHRPSAKPWSSFQVTRARDETPLRRIGFNLGAPGDRFDKDGTLWVRAYQGGRELKTTVAPKESIRWFVAGDAADWIGQSGVEGATSIRVPTALNQKSSKSGKRQFDVRLHFADNFAKPGDRIFDVAIEGQPVLTDFDIAGEGKLPVVREFKNVEIVGTLDIDLTPKKGKTILSGIELVESKAE